MNSGIIRAWSLKNKERSGLDLWIVPAWSLKNKEVFHIRLVDCPRAQDRPRIEP